MSNPFRCNPRKGGCGRTFQTTRGLAQHGSKCPIKPSTSDKDQPVSIRGIRLRQPVPIVQPPPLKQQKSATTLAIISPSDSPSLYSKDSLVYTEHKSLNSSVSLLDSNSLSGAPTSKILATGDALPERPLAHAMPVSKLTTTSTAQLSTRSGPSANSVVARTVTFEQQTGRRAGSGWRTEAERSQTLTATESESQGREDYGQSM
jgi:hypothetical protein